MNRFYHLLTKFALDWQINYPSHYVDYGLLQIHYAMPKLPHCYVVCQSRSESASSSKPSLNTLLNTSQLSAFFYQEAERLSLHHTDHPQNFVLIESGRLVRKRKDTRHAHIFILETRKQKTWLFVVLASKNTILALTGR